MRSALLLAISTIFLTLRLGAEAPRLTLHAATDRSIYREGARNEIYVGVRLSAEEPPDRPVARPGRNLALVIDRSGSMAGGPLAAVRAALAQTLQALEPEDVVAVTVFGSEVETLIEAQRRERIAPFIDRLREIEPAGGAALYDALNQGAAQLRRHASPARTNQLILVTDGPATKGPREFSDFARLAEAFASEGITLSTLGLGEEFDEDLLAAMARIGHGRFRHVVEAAGVSAALAAELAPPPPLIGHDATLSFQFTATAETVKSHGPRPATIAGTTVSFQLPRLYANTELPLLASAELNGAFARVFLPNVVTVRLRWKSAEGQTHELARTLSAHFTNDARALRDAEDKNVMRTAVRVHISEGLQETIDRLDEDDPRRALRALRTTLSEARDLNFELADPEIERSIAPLAAYVADVQTRGFSPRDRKFLRSGLGAFDPPHPAPDEKK